MKVCVLYSGGKDSNLALLKASKCFEVACLVSLLPESEDSYLFHYPNVWLVRLQAEALGLPLVVEKCPDEEKGGLESLYTALKRAMSLHGVEGVVTGAIKSTYQASRFQKVCWDLGLWCFNPLWLRDEISLLKEVLDKGFEVIFTRIAGFPLRKSLLGEKIGPSTIDMFRKYRRYVNPSGEGGEYETLVLDMPLFRKKLRILEYKVLGVDYDATLLVRKATLVGK